MGILSLALELYLASMLGVAALAKIDRPDHFAVTLSRHAILPAWSMRPVVALAPWLQLLTAALLVLGAFSLPTAAITVLWFLSFATIEGVLVATRRATECGCFGVAYPIKVDTASLASSILLVTLATLHGCLVARGAAIAGVWRLAVGLVFFAAGLWLLGQILARRRGSQRPWAVGGSKPLVPHTSKGESQ